MTEPAYREVLEIVRRVLREWNEARAEYANAPKGVEGHNKALRRLQYAVGALQELSDTMPPWPIVPEVAEDLDAEGVRLCPSDLYPKNGAHLYFSGEVRPIPSHFFQRVMEPNGTISMGLARAVEVKEIVAFFDMAPIAWLKNP